MEPISLTVDDVTYAQLAGTIDHSLLKPTLTSDDIRVGCKLAADYQVVSVCVRPADVALASSELTGTGVAVGTVVSFPHGDSTTSIKVAEAEKALEDGAVELDMVINIGWLLSGQDEDVRADIAAVVDVSGDALKPWIPPGGTWAKSPTPASTHSSPSKIRTVPVRMSKDSAIVRWKWGPAPPRPGPIDQQ